MNAGILLNQSAMNSILVMSIEWLGPETEESDPWGESRPKRPNIPILRNFSYTKWHAIQLGIFISILSYWGIQFGMEALVIVFLMATVMWAKGYKDFKDPNKECDHNYGFHDVREKPWYFITALAVFMGLQHLAVFYSGI